MIIKLFEHLINIADAPARDFDPLLGDRTLYVGVLGRYRVLIEDPLSILNLLRSLIGQDLFKEELCVPPHSVFCLHLLFYTELFK